MQALCQFFFMFPVKVRLILSHPIPRLRGFSSQPEAITDTPSFLVKICTMPLPE
jgi:hypothetical protein